MVGRAHGRSGGAPGGWRPWLELVRVPNLFSVPGDPWAGAVVAAGVRGEDVSLLVLAATGLSALFLYAFGLVLNDWADLEADRRERPERPLPRGAVRPGSALAGAGMLAAAGLVCAAAAGMRSLWVALVLACMVVLYDLWLKRRPVAGALAMGACRGLSVLLGVSAVGAAAEAVAVAGVVTGYVAVLTGLAALETRPALHARLSAFLPAVILAVGGGALLAGPAVFGFGVFGAWSYTAGGALWVLAIIRAFQAGARLRRAVSRRDCLEYRRGVVLLISTLVPWQCIWLFAWGGGRGAGLGVLLLAGMAAAARLGRTYSGS